MFKADHQRVKDLFAPYEASTDRAMKRTLAEQIFVAWDTHAPWDENVFYPAVNKETDEGPELVKESLSEHAMGNNLIQALQSMAQDTEACDATFQELRQNVAHHVEEEEAAMCPLAEQALAEDLDEMREKMQALNKELMAS